MWVNVCRNFAGNGSENRARFPLGVPLTSVDVLWNRFAVFAQALHGAASQARLNLKCDEYSVS
jgi:hypothetical protein